MAGAATEEGDGLPFYPPLDMTLVFASENRWLGDTRRRYRYWAARWKELKTCPICWDALPAAETTGECIGRSREKNLGLCPHLHDVCIACTKEHCKTHLGDAEKITGAGLPCVDPTCSKPLTLPVLGASWTEQRERPSGGTYDVVDRLLSTQDCDKARRFMRAA